MALTECPDCHHEISEAAAICVHCGRPMKAATDSGSDAGSHWQAVAQAKTPINVFALAMMACAALLGLSATQISGCDGRTALTYTIHAFLAVAAMFFVTLLFCRRGIYHPIDLAQAGDSESSDTVPDRPGIAAALIVLMVLAYGWYQFNRGDPCPVPPGAGRVQDQPATPADEGSRPNRAG